jgi:hypothetical protein
MVAEIPQMDPRPMRTVADMGMGSMAGMNMGMKAKDMPAMSKNDTTQDGMKGIAGMDMGIVVFAQREKRLNSALAADKIK